MKFYSFQPLEDDVVQLRISGEIVDSKSWWEDYLEEEYGIRSTGAKQFAEELEKYEDKKIIKVIINSPGGDVFAATSIYNMLKRTNKKIEVELDGFAGSAATIIMMAGDKISMPVNALVMIHDPLITLSGAYNTKNLQEHGKVLDKVKDAIMQTYKTKVNLDDKTLSKLMSDETWMTAQESLDYGFVDEILYNKTIDVIQNKKSLIINNISYSHDKIKEIINKNVKNYKEILERNDKKEGKFFENDKKEDEKLNETEIKNLERKRIKSLNQYINKINNELIDEAIENEWDEKELVYQAVKRDMLITNHQTIFDKHLESNKKSGVDDVEVDTQEEKQNKLDLTTSKGVQDYLDILNNVQYIK